MLWTKARHFVSAVLMATASLIFPINGMAGDPSIEWNTFVGKNGQHLGYSIAVDSSKNVFIGGLTNTTWDTTMFGNPVNDFGGAGYTDGVVAKFNSSGTLQWYTFIGVSTGDAVTNIEVDSSGNVYAIGYTSGTWGSPVHAFVGGDLDTFVVKLNGSTGAVVWNTFIGSTSNDYADGITLDGEGNVYVGGESYRKWHADFDNVKGTDKGSDGYQGYIVKLNGSGTYQWHRFLTTYQVSDVAVHDGFLYTIKKGLFYSGSWNYPAEVGKYNTTTGDQSWTKKIGSGSQEGFGIEVDASANIFIKGYSSETWGSPVRAYSGGNDHYVAKLNSDGDLQWNTFLGQSGDDSCRSGQSCGLSLDSSGNIYTVGFSSATWGSPKIAHAGGARDGFIAKLDSSGNLGWNLFLGGTNSDWMIAMDIDSSSDLYVSGYTQQTSWGSPIKFPSCFYCQSVVKIDNPLNATPVMNAMDNIAALGEGSTITITGTCTDSDSENTLTVTTTQLSGTSCGSILGSPDSGTGGSVSSSATCTAPSINDDTNLVFRLSCSDGTDTVTDDVTVGANAAPTASDISRSFSEDGYNEFTLLGADSGNDSLNYFIVTQPAHGTLTGTPPNYKYTADNNYSGTDFFSYRVSDGYSFSPIKTVTFTVNSVNDAPVIDDSSGPSEVDCSGYRKCGLPSFSSTDADGDSLTTTWKKVSGTSELTFTSDGAIDIEASRAARGTYYVQYTVGDGTSSASSKLVAITVPNNPPLIEDETEDIEIADATFESSKFILPRFKRNMDITTAFTDYDNDTLSYKWKLKESFDSSQAGVTSFEANKGSMRFRMAGDFTVVIEVDDGSGGVTEQEIVISIPVPEVTEDDLETTITTWSEGTTSDTLYVEGTLKSPVWPVVLLNGVTTASVELGLNSTATLVTKTIEENELDSYTFTATDVPANADGSEINIEVLTSVNGSNTSLVAQTARLTGGVATPSSVKINANWGCTLVRPSPQLLRNNM